MEGVQAGLAVVVVSTVAQRIDGLNIADGSSGVNILAPGVVLVLGFDRAGGIHNTDNIALKVGDVIVKRQKIAAHSRAAIILAIILIMFYAGIQSVNHLPFVIDQGLMHTISSAF